MTGRHALLIGVPQCDDDRFSEIGDVVRNDVRSMRRALEQSGYSVTTFGTDGGPEPSRTRLRRAIDTACRQAPRDGVLLLYFSGHGVSVGGQDYLVPSDADRDGGTADLVPVVPADLAECRARLVVFFVDACRDDPAQEREPGAVGGVVPYPADGSFVLVTGCEAGQRCHYTETGSVFTQALAQVLDRRHPARTLVEVIDEVSLEIRRRAARNEALRQSPDVRHRTMLMDAKDVVVCDGDELTGAWRRAAGDTELWQRCDQEDSAREAVLALVEGSARRCGEAYGTLRERVGIDDPWFDQNHPIRTLERMTMLLGDATRLGPAEVAALIAAPFLREVVLAEGIRLTAGIAPTDFTRTYREGPRTDLEITHEMHQQVLRRAEGLDRRGLTKERDALAMWLVHQWLATRQSLWHGAAAADCYQRGARLLDGHATGLTARELPKLTEALLRAVGARPGDPIVVERLGAAYVDDRWRALAAVLWLGGIMAADLRRMPPVIADHIGTRMELPLSAMKNAADRLTWARREDALELQMSCDHPAQHAAFEDVVACAAAARTTIAGLALDKEIAAALPARFTDRGLRPERRPDDTAAFEVPLSRFRLAEDKVRELLMGRQLYDDPALAIRELYQNALDACRYRDTRLEGLRLSRRDPGGWNGRIVFRQGFEEGREYIECEDNGVGMDTETLKQVFASAGERFVYRESFRAEQAAWQELDPPLQLVSNSQFGVGVFSYFMLADEITVLTRPVGLNGIASDRAHRVDIASNGSLFQITTADVLPAGGTRVRLYMTANDERVNVLTTMRKLLWISDYRVEVTAHDSATEVWKPRELRYQDETAVSLKCGEDLWWVSDEGGLAADGIRTNEEIFGLILNLRDTRRPQFTVDRKKLRNWDKKWVRACIERSLPKLLNWPGLTLSWLWQVTESAPEVAQQIFDYLVRENASIPVGSVWGHGARVAVGDMGCFPKDGELFNPENWARYYARWFSAWRAGRWARLVGSRPHAMTAPHVVNGEGLPAVDPTDAELLSNLNHLHNDGILYVDELLLAAVHTDQPLSDRLRRLRRFAITGLPIGEIRSCPPVALTLAKKEDFPLVRALAAWSPPGSPPRRRVAGWLVKASAELDLPLGQVLARASDHMPDGWSAPDIVLGTLAEYTCTSADAKLLSTDLDGIPPWAEEPLTPSHIVAASAATGREVSQVLTMCDTFAPLGVEVAARDAYPAEPTAMEIEALRHVYSPGTPLVPLQLLMVAAKVGGTLADAHQGLRRLDDLGLVRLPDITALPDYAPKAEDLDFIETHLMEYTPALRRRRFIREKPCGRLAMILKARRTSQRSIARAAALVPFASPTEPVTYPELVNLAREYYCSIADARNAVLDAYPEADVPDVTPACESLYAHFEIAPVLLDLTRWGRKGPVTWQIEPGDIVSGAVSFGRSIGDFLSMIEPYRQLGAPVPELSAEVRAQLGEVFPDEYDEDMLTVSGHMNYDFYISEIDPLRLVQISGRLGWTPAETHRRLSALTAIGVRQDYPIAAPPAEIVRWQDLLLLTEHLDGHAPAVSGRVTGDHVERAAEATGESPAWIAERLRHYAPLFALDLEPPVA
ncbi:caspase family protein [Actinomadura fulvescens]|uniref:HD domain-containing protein n=1 Tax=Actinomadura fulvescens TaxID=46160 RepID=UPI0031DAAF3B